ncbi:YetF domain-containing protein [Novosphingobium sp. PS1R-30]|uniref:YetF domain-containing protein n=1 Tax=Novosphingobium anseongense TaxID=3133436 RepID=A0ABU8S2E6_9SPHN
MLFDTWQGLVRVIVMAVISYPALILILRLSGKRTLAKMNAFDLVVTVGLGSTLATVILTKDVALVEGLLTFALLALLQLAVALSARRYKLISRLVKSNPRILFRDGQFIEQALRDERVVRGEIEAAVRGAGIGDLAAVAAVVLETDGSFSVISRQSAGARTALPQGASA